MMGATVKLLEIKTDGEGIFRNRPNRFLGVVDIINGNKVGSKNLQVHIHDPGRLTELLYPGNRVLLRAVRSKTRKTAWDLVAARHNEQWVLVHSGFHRAIAEKILRHDKINPFSGIIGIKPEVVVGHSRLDFLLELPDKARKYVEVKGCTLTRDGVALFPDAPTTRGTRHLETLAKLCSGSVSAAVIILIFRTDSKCFKANIETDPAFTAAFGNAQEHGVEVYPMVLGFEDGWVYFEKEIPVCPG